MKNLTRPVRVAMMDDDYMAGKWLVEMLSRDTKTEVSLEASTPDELLEGITTCRPDLVLLDPEYRSGMNFNELLVQIRRAAPHLPVLCLSQYGDQDVVGQAILNGVRGFLLKHEVQLALAHIILCCFEYDFIYSSGIDHALIAQRANLPGRRRIIYPWQPNPRLGERHLKAIWLTVVFGMSARLAAAEAGLSENSIHTYIGETRQILISETGDIDPMPALGKKRIPSSDQNYLLFTRFEQFDQEPE